jgi:integrase/recombinase XerD
MELNVLVEKFLLAYEGVRSPNTVTWYKSCIKHLLDDLGNKEIAQITIDDLRRRYAQLSRVEKIYKNHPHPGRKPKKKMYSKFTLHGFVRSWRRLFSWAVEEGHLNKNPAKRLMTPSLPDPDPKAITKENVFKIIKAIEDYSTNPERDLAIVLFFASTNARLGGVAKLKLSHLDIENRTAIVHEKGKGGSGKNRPVFFDVETADVLRKWLEIRPDDPDDNRVFMLTTSGISQMLDRMGKKICLKEPHNPHAFRHGYAKGVLGQGANLAQVSQMMGHSTSSITVDYYSQFAVRELREFHDRYHWLSDSD